MMGNFFGQGLYLNDCNSSAGYGSLTDGIVIRHLKKEIAEELVRQKATKIVIDENRKVYFITGDAQT